MKNEIKIIGVQKKENRIIYDYEAYGDIEKYLIKEKKFYIEYDENIEKVPESILVIPFLCNILPIVWITNSTLIVDKIDKNFYESIDKFKKGYIDMYPKIEFKGSVKYNKLEKNHPKQKEKTSAAFFSGGVDAVSTLVSHITEKIFTITMWGADIKVDNKEGWNVVKDFIKNNSLDVKNQFVKSSFREVINEQKLTELVIKKANDAWWHGFQNGIGLIGHAAPLAYLYNIDNLYIASSYTAKSKVPCASDPTIDNYVRFVDCHVIHDGYEYERQEKIANICDYRKNTHQDIKLRVCWKSDSGENCNHCEKCIRTILGIVAEGENPIDYGFNPDYKFIKKFVKKKLYVTSVAYPFWQAILDRFEENKDKLKDNAEIQWIYNINLDKLNKNYRKLYKRVFRFIKNKLKIK